jgi:hypothetical protein
MTTTKGKNFNPPSLSAEEVLLFINRDYGIDGKIELLSSYADQNFLIKTSERKKYVFKISNHSDEIDFWKHKTSHLSSSEKMASIARRFTLTNRARISSKSKVLPVRYLIADFYLFSKVIFMVKLKIFRNRFLEIWD